jgi:hypothetical protein
MNGWMDFINILYLRGIHHRSLPDEYEYTSSENRGSLCGPQKQTGDFFENGCNDFDKFQ